MPNNRYIELSDTIIDRTKITAINRDEKVPGRVHVTFDNGLIHYFDGGDAVTLWKEIRDRPEESWRDE